MRLLFALWCLLAASAYAQPAAQSADFVQRLGAQLPLQATFTDESGHSTHLAAYFGAQPAVLVLGYYRCPNLCSTLMDGVLESLADAHLPPRAYRILGVSIDPSETAGIAARKKASYMPLLARTGDLHLLTGDARQIAALAESAGFRYRYDAEMRQFAHPAGFLIATPDGKISHYFMGVRFDARDVRLALVDASSGRIGTPVDRLLLLCSHVDPATGRYTLVALNAVRAVCLAVLLLLAGWMWRQYIKGRGRR
jgi:protein SCO1/2